MTERLSIRGDLRSTFFDHKSMGLDAGATFMLETDDDETNVRRLLEGIDGVTLVQLDLHNENDVRQ